MEPVIYSASLLWAFISPLGSILFTGLFGLVALVVAIVQKKQGKGVRIAMGVASLLLFAFSIASAAGVFTAISSGAETAILRVNDKTIGTSTSDNGGTSRDYILKATAGLVSYNIRVNPQAYELVQVNTCYQVTFYKYKSLTNSMPETEMSRRVEIITRIETVDSAACP
jgi:hypothetical protein